MKKFNFVVSAVVGILAVGQAPVFAQADATGKSVVASTLKRGATGALIEPGSGVGTVAGFLKKNAGKQMLVLEYAAGSAGSMKGVATNRFYLSIADDKVSIQGFHLTKYWTWVDSGQGYCEATAVVSQPRCTFYSGPMAAPSNEDLRSYKNTMIGATIVAKNFKVFPYGVEVVFGGTVYYLNQDMLDNGVPMRANMDVPCCPEIATSPSPYSPGFE